VPDFKAAPEDDGDADDEPVDGPASTPRRAAPAKSPRITNIVFMGMGEPLSNFTEVVRAIRILTAPWSYHISARKITVSTVGVPAPIRRLAEQIDLPITLAISLHAPNDDLRRKLIPWAEYTTVKAIADAADDYFRKTGREVTLEYILLRQVNDQPEHARELAALCRRLRCHVNLIRYNEVAGLPYGRPATPDVLRFQQILRDAGVNVHIRASRGRDIAAACGQLRHQAAAS
jgi:23S rRNA (adenine2503-C2)-methyltransferase